MSEQSPIAGARIVVFPAPDLDASVESWTKLLGRPPLFGNDDFSIFDAGNVQIGLSRRPWVDYPLVFWKVDNLERAHKDLVARGAVPMGDIGDGDPDTAIVKLPTVILAVLQTPDGNLLAIREDLPWE